MSNDPLNSPEAQKYRKDFPTRNVAAMWLRNTAGQFLFVRTHRLPQCWQPPSGGKDPEDESLLDTAIRELREETGVMIDTGQVKFILEMPYDFGEGKVQFFMADLPADQQLTIDENEIDETRWVTLDEAAQLPVYPATRRCIDFLKKSS